MDPPWPADVPGSRRGRGQSAEYDMPPAVRPPNRSVDGCDPRHALRMVVREIDQPGDAASAPVDPNGGVSR
ncbi:hypothetical protein GCM10010193_50080 [Kitasatospora atroaurantiaca]